MSLGFTVEQCAPQNNFLDAEWFWPAIFGMWIFVFAVTFGGLGR